MKDKPFSIKAVLFDFDGTLTRPGAIDFSLIRDSICCPPDMPILEFIESLSTADQQERTLSTLEEFEFEAAEKSEPNHGAEELIRFLRSNRFRIGIVSRNTLFCIDRALMNFKTVRASDFDVIISRDDPIKPKPEPDSIHLAAQRLNIDISETLLVGDYIFDILAGKRAGAVTIFLDNGQKSEHHQESEKESDYTISDLSEVKTVLRQGMPLSPGKLPNDLLNEVLDQFAFTDPSVLISPGVGEDTAAVNVDGEEVLVLKSDPITYATDSIGRYAVLVNANDIATSGAVPRWFLSTLMFPCGTTVSDIYNTIHELKDVCLEWGMTLCGGHTEITDAVNRPVITGMLAGTVPRTGLIDKRNMRTGDLILLTKKISVEGTSIIAREFGDKLKILGMSESEIETCRGFLSQISIIREAQIAARFSGTSAMHDITEGGLATAVEELSIAGRHKIRVFMDKIPYFPETKKICRLYDIDPLGLIGSGSLLIACRPDDTNTLTEKIQEAGIEASVIAEVLQEGHGIEAWKEGHETPWPRFEVDEITRLFKDGP